MDSRELTEWQALYMIEPLPEDRADLRAGIVASYTVAPHMRRGHKAPSPSDILPDYDNPPTMDRVETPEKTAAMKAKFAHIKAMFQRKKTRDG